MEPGADGPDGDAERVRDLLIGLVGDVTQHDGDAELFGQRRERGLDLVGEPGRDLGRVGRG